MLTVRRVLGHPVFCLGLALLAVGVAVVNGLERRAAAVTLVYPAVWVLLVGLIVCGAIIRGRARENVAATLNLLCFVLAIVGSAIGDVAAVALPEEFLPPTVSRCPVALPEGLGEVTLVVKDTHAFMDPLEYRMEVVTAGGKVVSVDLGWALYREGTVPLWLGACGGAPCLYFKAEGEHTVNLRDGTVLEKGFETGTYLGAFDPTGEKPRFVAAVGAERRAVPHGP